MTQPTPTPEGDGTGKVKGPASYFPSIERTYGRPSTNGSNSSAAAP